MCGRSYTSPSQIGIIGGTGLDNPDILTDRTEKEVETPYGKVNIPAQRKPLLIAHYTHHHHQCHSQVTSLSM